MTPAILTMAALAAPLQHHQVAPMSYDSKLSAIAQACIEEGFLPPTYELNEVKRPLVDYYKNNLLTDSMAKICKQIEFTLKARNF